MSTRKQIEAVYPLSPMQQGMLFHTLYDPESGVYFEQLACSLRGHLDRQAFERAWQETLDRHGVLRTSFAWRSVEKPVQAVHREVRLPLVEEDWRGLAAAEQASQLESFLAADRQRGFDLAKAPLIRLALMRTGEESYQFVWSHHHIVMDGWSLATLLQEMFALYDALADGRTLALPPIRPYRDYIAFLQAQDMAAAEAYWRQALAGFTTPTPLVVDHPVAQDADGRGKVAEQEIKLPAGTTEALAAMARQHGLTLSTVVQGAWALLLHRYSGEDEVVFGTTVSGRPPDLAGAEAMVGVFINTLPVRARVAGDMPVIAFLQELQSAVVEMRQYEHTPLTLAQGWSEVPRGRQLFESILVFENYPVDAALRENRGRLQIGDVRSFEQTNYPMTVVSGPGKELALKISYQRQRFADATIGRMLRHLAELLQGMAGHPMATVETLPMLTAAEIEETVVAWNATARPFPSELCLHQLFEQQVVRAPEATALLYAPDHAGSAEPVVLTYGELNARANQLARHLRVLGVGPETLVGLMVERSPDLLVGLLGILKAGGAYVPMDPAYPAERLAMMLEDAGVRVLVTERDLVSRLEQDGRSPLEAGTVRVVALDADWTAIAGQPAGNLESLAGAGNLAYVIYTSGSTGVPKGVMVEHRGLVNHVTYLVERYGLVPADRMLQFMSYSFDAAAEELYTPLVGGATLVMPGPARELMGAELSAFCRRHGITIVHFPAAPWHQWVDDLEAGDQMVEAPVRLLIVGGEEPSMDRLRAWVRRLGRPSAVLNAYGPTEATVAATTYLWEATEASVAALARLPIGQPEPNVRVYVVDRAMHPVPVGVPGELLIAGVGVARGYLNRPALSTERFGTLEAEPPVATTGTQQLQIAFPGSGAGQPAHRVYRTGDMVRWLPDGNLDFLGRVDGQVKVRGFRVELGEIEAALARLPGVRQAVVMAREGGALGRRLVAYVVAEDGRQLEAAALRQELREALPEHMVPVAFMIMEALPLSPAGKVDRQALPAVDGNPEEWGGDFVAPRTPEEEILAGLVAQLLQVSRAGATDSFFDLGGHSLLATRLTSRIREVFGVELSVRTVFDHSRVADLAAVIGAELRRRGEQPGGEQAAVWETLEEGPRAVARPAGQPIPLSFAQQRLWFLDQLEPGNLFHNIPTAVRLVGELDVEALRRALDEIVRRHDVLRTTFQATGGVPMQVVATELHLDLPVVDLRAVAAEQRQEEALRLATEEIRRPFDLAHGPLVRGLLLRLAEDEHIAVLTIHHIVADGWSMGILVRELTTSYQALAAGRSSALPDLPLQYADYAAWQRRWLGQGDGKSARGEDGLDAESSPLQRQLRYWREQLQGAPPRLELPTDRPRPAVQSANGAVYSFRVPAQLSQDLLAFAQREGVTLFMALLAAYQTVLHRYADQDDICVGTAIANRTYAALEPLMGFFVNTLVLRSRFDDGPTFRQLLSRVRETALTAYAHQDLPFEMLVDALQVERDLSHTPLFQAGFSLQNVPVEPQELPGLRIEPLQPEKGIAQFDMLLMVSETAEGLAGAWEYNSDLFDERTIRAMAGHLQTLLQAAIADPQQPVATLPLLAPEERQAILVEWNRTATDTPMDRCAHQLVEARAAAQPGHPAIVAARPLLGPGDTGEVLTYGQLDRRANQLAHYLRKCGVGPETITGIFFDRSPLTFVAILAALKAGGAYLPVDPGYPAERIEFMLQDSRAPVILTRDALAHWLPVHEAAVVCLDRDWPTIALEEDTALPLASTPFNAAYCIYTSGSTGKPKAAILRHRGLANLTYVQRQAFDITPDSRILQFAPLSFDASVWETFMALANGATLVLAPQDTMASGPELLRLLRDQAITTVTLPPSLLAVLEPGDLPTLRTVVAAGERCTRDIVQRWAPGRRFFNAYGPTETTVCASMAQCTAEDQGDPSIGRPIANTRAFVVDRNFQPVPVGVPGELVIGGVNVGRGYLSRPELTAERYIPNPFAIDVPEGRRGWGYTVQAVEGSAETADILYRTGDLVRWRADGSLEFLGRIDHQVKVRGFRIELGEVEAALRGHPAVLDAVAVARDDALIAYFVPEDGQQPDATSLRSFLRQSLPEHMVPTAFVEMETFPLTPAGKIDRQALPPPGATRQAAGEYVAPRTETEARLAQMAAELLKLERTGVEDNFFELGGHSLLATQLISRVREEMGVDVPLRTLFERPTVAGLAAAVDEARGAQAGQQAERERIGALLQQVKGLNPEQVQALLAAKRGEQENR